MASEPSARSESFTAFIPEFERLIVEVMEEWKVPGLAVAVVQNGEVAVISPYGLRDVEAGLKVTTDTQFLIGSVTKSFTSTGLALKKVLKLAEAGLSYRLLGRHVGLSKNTVGAILQRARAANQ